MNREARLVKFRRNLDFTAGPAPAGNVDSLIAMLDGRERLDDARGWWT